MSTWQEMLAKHKARHWPDLPGVLEPPSLKGATPTLTAHLFIAQQGRCFHCLKPMRNRSWSLVYPAGWTREHVIPKAMGGASWRNIVLAHHDCNNARRDLPLSPQEYRRARLIILAVAWRRRSLGLNDNGGQTA